MMLPVQFQVWKAERRVGENRDEAHKIRMVAAARAEQKSKQQTSDGFDARSVVGTLVAKAQKAYLASVFNLKGYPPSIAA